MILLFLESLIEFIIEIWMVIFLNRETSISFKRMNIQNDDKYIILFLKKNTTALLFHTFIAYNANTRDTLCSVNIYNNI